MAPPPAKKRRISPDRSETPEPKDETPVHIVKKNDDDSEETLNSDVSKPETSTSTTTTAANAQPDKISSSTNNLTPAPDAKTTTTTTTSSSSSSNTSDRLARFTQLRSRATQSARSNLAEAKAEAQRSALDPGLLASLNRKSAIASHNLLKAETEDSGGKGAFERKRAWDYTIEESERWDERVERKRGARDNNAFADYAAEAGKVYERQIRELEKLAKAGNGGTGGSREEYEAEKRRVIEDAARSGGLEIVEMENGDIVAIDREGRFYADSENTGGFTEQRPKKENVDRLVEDLRKADEVRMKKRRDRGRDEDAKEGDVTYINEKNKQFNRKLARFYDRYTTDIRESFERGTAI